jgi:Uma2 family endonuclease
VSDTLQNETLEEYIIVQQDIPCVTIFRRADGWAKEEVRGWSTPVQIKSLDLTLDMKTIYAGVLP